MEVRAVGKYVRVQPRKVRIVADQVKGKSAGHSVALLRYQPSKGARALRKVLISAMANAAENHGINPEDLRIARISVDEGPKLKRFTQKAMGRGARIIKKTSHITVVVEPIEAEARVKPHGTKAKKRPSFEAAAKAASKKKAEAKKEVVEEVPAEEPEVMEAAEAPVEAEAAAEPKAEETAAEAGAAEEESN